MGAVAYLSHSKYGINDEIRINNNSNYITGYAAADGTNQSSYPGVFGTAESVTLPYNTKTGYKATTTGNITGIYDMSGGAFDVMASFRNGTLGSSELNESDITSHLKYFDIYPSNNTITSYHNRILGDATGEMGGFYYYKDNVHWALYHNSWYADDSEFIYSDRP